MSEFLKWGIFFPLQFHYYSLTNTLRASQGFFIFLLKTLIMQKFKLSWMALLRNDEHARLIEQLCGILDDCRAERTSIGSEGKSEKQEKGTALVLGMSMA